jgi:hypothetical protein
MKLSYLAPNGTAALRICLCCRHESHVLTEQFPRKEEGLAPSTKKTIRRSWLPGAAVKNISYRLM